MSTMWVVFAVVFVIGQVSRWGWRSSAFGYRLGRRGRLGGWGMDDGLGRLDSRRLDDLMNTLEQKSQDVELLQSRVNELENRLDFAERLLAERRNL